MKLTGKSMMVLAAATLAIVPAMAADDVAAAPEAAAEQQEWPAGAPDAKSYGYTALMLGIASPFSLPWDFNWDVFGLAANLGYTDVNKMYGIEIGAGANTARLDMKGLQAAILFNFANRNMYGSQVSFVNICNRESYGFSADILGMNRQFYGLSADVGLSMTDRDFYGMSLALLGSAVREDMWGMQTSIGANFARRVHGLQLAIGYNQTSELRGAQIGLVNYATACSAGFQVGIVNIIADNQIPFIPLVNAYF